MSSFKLKPLVPKKGGTKKGGPPQTLRLGKGTYVSPGVHKKPAYCKNNCPLATISSGIAFDYFPKNPKIGILLNFPRAQDVTDRVPGKSGMAWWWQKFIFDELGRRKDEYFLMNTLRCYCGKDYPKGKWVEKAEKACRYYDGYQFENGNRVPGGLLAWKPDLFVATFDLFKAPLVGAFYRLAKNDIAKAFDFADMGYRPLVLSGQPSMELVAPWSKGKGGMKTWHSHWFEGDWPYG